MRGAGEDSRPEAGSQAAPTRGERGGRPAGGHTDAGGGSGVTGRGPSSTTEGRTTLDFIPNASYQLLPLKSDPPPAFYLIIKIPLLVDFGSRDPVLTIETKIGRRAWGSVHV